MVPPQTLTMTRVYTDASMGADEATTTTIGIHFENDSERDVSCNVHSPSRTIQEAEVSAVYHALHCLGEDEGAIIVTDSKHAIDCIQTHYSKFDANDWKTKAGTPVKASDIIKKCRAFIGARDSRGVKTSLEFTHSHSGNPGNDAADRLAATTMKQSLKT